MSRFQDSKNILLHLNLLRVWNLFLLRSSYYLSRILKREISFGYPASLSIEPTTACNLGCPECPSGLKQFTRPTGKIDLNLHQNMLEQVKQSVFYINYYFQGEPFLHPQFLELIKQAKQAKIYTSTSTNAHFIDQQKAEEIVESGLDRLIISIDGLTQETYEQYRVHGNLEKVILASKELVSAKRKLQSTTPHLIFQFLAVKPNEHEIPQVFELANEIGIDEVRIKTAQLYDYEHGNSLMPENEKYSRYIRQKDGTYKIKGSPGNHCWRMWSGSVFTWDGKVVPCCFDKDAKHVLGDITTDPFQSIWKSHKYRAFRQAILINRQEIDICKNCSEGTQVWS
ncbi:MAG: SPASM domain-containing protein [Bacteroidetes bacterium]|nr:SPASM domain-containing protein [Bacteroidota bacterium]